MKIACVLATSVGLWICTAVALLWLRLESSPNLTRRTQETAGRRLDINQMTDPVSVDVLTMTLPLWTSLKNFGYEIRYLPPHAKHSIYYPTVQSAKWEKFDFDNETPTISGNLSTSLPEFPFLPLAVPAERFKLNCSVILTSGNAESEFTNLLVWNHLEFARATNCCYLHLRRPSNNNDTVFTMEGSSPHFWRYLAFWDLTMHRLASPEKSWVFLLDSDAMFTNFNKSIVEIVGDIVEQMDDPKYSQPYKTMLQISKDRQEIDTVSRFRGQASKVAVSTMPKTTPKGVTMEFPHQDFGEPEQALKLPSVVFSTDVSCFDLRYPINSGAMLWRGTFLAQMISYLVLTAADVRCSLVQAKKFRATELFDQPILSYVLQKRLNFDFERLRALCQMQRVRRGEDPLSHRYLVRSDSGDIVVASSRVFNSFNRGGYRDAEQMLWKSGDFVAHFSGMDEKSRTAKLLATCKQTSKRECPWTFRNSSLTQ